MLEKYLWLYVDLTLFVGVVEFDKSWATANMDEKSEEEEQVTRKWLDIDINTAKLAGSKSHPTLTLEPSVLLLGQKVTATCRITSYKQTCALGWTLYDGNISSQWSIAQDGKMRQWGSNRPKCLELSIGYDNENKALTGTLTAMVTEDFRGKLFCYLMKASEVYSPIIEPQVKASKFLKIIYPPEPPNLEIQYDEPYGVVYEGTVKSFNCSAKVGSVGYLTWLLESMHGYQHGFWDVHLNREVYGENVDGVKIIVVEISTEEVPFVRSTMELAISKTFENVIIACRSGTWPGALINPYSGDDPNLKYSLPLSVEKKKNKFFKPKDANLGLMFEEAEIEVETTQDLDWEDSTTNQVLFMTILAVVASSVLYYWSTLSGSTTHRTKSRESITHRTKSREGKYKRKRRDEQ